LVFKNNSPVLIETAIVAAVMTLLGLLGLYLMPAFYLATLLLPVPLAYLIIKRNLLYGLLALGVTALMLSFAISGIKPVFLLLLQFGPVGIIIGLLLKNKVAVDKSMAVLFFWALAVTGINLLFSFVLSGSGLSRIATEFNTTMEQMSQFYLQSGLMDEAGRQEFLEVSQQAGRLVRELLPGGMAVWTIIITIFTYFITRHLARGLGYNVSGNLRFTEWQLPWYSIWLVIAGLALTMAGEEFSLELVGIAGKNILYISVFIFLILGTAVLAYFIRVWKISTPAKIFIIIAMALYFPLAAAIILSLGVVDPVANLRRLPVDNDMVSKGGSG
jgi:uncharacterized protein YybS (DUF2232 family)